MRILVVEDELQLAGHVTRALDRRGHRVVTQPDGALGRRTATLGVEDLLQVADLHMDVRHRRVTRAGKIVALSPREFDVLQVFLHEPGRAFSRTELCERVWQRDHEYDTRTVEIFITRLRKKVDTGFSVPLIHTLRAVGYTVRAPD